MEESIQAGDVKEGGNMSEDTQVISPDLELLMKDGNDEKGFYGETQRPDGNPTPKKGGNCVDVGAIKAESARRKSSSTKPSGLAALKAAKRAEMAAKSKVGELKSRDDRVGKVRGPTGLAYSPDMLLHTCTWDSNHIESPARLERVVARCQEMGLLDKCTRIPPREASDHELLCYHDQEFLDTMVNSRLMAESEAEEVCKGLDSVYLCPHTDRAARLAAGGAIDLVKGVLEGNLHNGMGLIRPPGHHAMASTPCGFCGFNNAVVAAHAALEAGAKKIVIVDFDLHHGQGTQQAFYSDPRVVYMSVHRYEKGAYWPHLRESNFDYIGEAEGKGFNVNVALNSIGCGPEDYLAIFHMVFLPIAIEFQPDLVIVSAGYDAAIGCPEGEMMVTPAAYPHLLHQLSSLGCGRLVALLEGGYCLDSLAESAALTLRELLGSRPAVLKGGKVAPSVQESIQSTITALRPHWQCLQHWSTWQVTGGAPTPSDTYHLPSKVFSPPADWPPSEFPTRDYYLVYDEDQRREWEVKIAALVLNTPLPLPTTSLVLCYDSAMERHHDDEPHPECPERTARIWEMLEENGVTQREGVLRVEARRLLKEEADMVHEPEHWEKLHMLMEMEQKDMDAAAEEMNSIYLNPFSLDCALLAAGGVLQTVDKVLESGGAGLAVVRPPGHHAEPHTPHGFCLFNNVAIAAERAVREEGLDRVLILDWDVHHGNGIQHMFYQSNKVLYISLHRYDDATFFPSNEDANYDMVGEGLGQGFNVNIPFNGRKMGDTEYLMAFQSIVLPIAYEFDPQLVLVSAGFDAAKGDPLGGYRLSPGMYGHMTQGLLGLAGGRVVVCLEGGYCLPAISECMLQCARAILGDPLPQLSLEAEVKLSAVDTVRDVIAAQMPFWDCLDAYKKKVPHDINAFFALADVEEIRIDEDPEEVVLSRSFRKMELVSKM